MPQQYDSRPSRRRSPHALRARAGFTLVWFVVVLATMATVAALATPNLEVLNDYKRIQTAAAMLKQVAVAVDSYEVTVRRDGGSGQLPGMLTQLINPIANGDSTGCPGNVQVVAGNDVGDWPIGAPYIGIYMPSDGLMTPIGRLNNFVTKHSDDQQPFFITIPSVHIQDARALDLYVDGVLGSGADTVQYTAVASDSTVTVHYRIFLPNSDKAC